MKRRVTVRVTWAAMVAFGLVLITPVTARTEENVNTDTFKALDLFGEVFDRVRQDYVTPVPDKKLVESAIRGMLTSLDPHSSYMDAKEYSDMQVQTEGQFGGLGIEVTQEKGLIKIVTPIDDTPGSRAGLKPGDLIVALDGKIVTSMTLEDAVNHMRGAPDTQVKLTIRRGNLAPFDVTLTRAIIHIASVKGMVMRGSIGYLRIASFSAATTTELQKAFATVKKKAGKITGVVLDLRNNPGGLLDQAVGVSDSFLEHGEIVSTRGRSPNMVQRWDAHGGDITGGVPIVILINGGTASAAEIVSGALQDNHRALILGTRSFGKGSVQTIMPLSGDNGAIRLTTARYYTPSGKSIQDEGISPDIVVEPAKVETIAETGQLREADLKGALKNTGPDSGAATPAEAPASAADAADDATGGKDGAEKDMAAAEEKDYQLTRALDLVKGAAFFAAQSAN